MPALRRWPNYPALLILTVVGAACRAQAPTEPLPRPLTLEGALNYALKHNPELRRIRQQVAEKEGVVMEANARRQPTLSAAGSYGYTQPRLFEGFPGFPNVPLPDPNAWDVSVSVRKLVYSGGGTKAGVHSAEERAAAARSTVTAAVNRIVFAVEENFLGALLAREEIGVHEEAIQVLQREATQAKTRRAAGTGADFEIMRANVAVANARPALIRAQNAIHAREDALRSVLGADPDLAVDNPQTDLELQGQLAMSPIDIPLADAVQTARTHRPELFGQDHVIAAAREDMKTAKSARRPQASLVGGYDYRKATYAGRFGETLNGFTLGVEADWPIFDGRATEARVRQASAREAQALASKDELRLRINLEVRDAHRALTEAAQLLASAGQVIGEATESVRLAQARVAAGTATQLDVLTAQSALTEARSNLSQAQHDYALGAARLRAAMGTSSQAE